MRNSKTWPMRAWRRVTFSVITIGAAAVVFASVAGPSKFVWN